jgi:hypothetical protein
MKIEEGRVCRVLKLEKDFKINRKGKIEKRITSFQE